MRPSAHPLALGFIAVAIAVASLSLRFTAGQTEPPDLLSEHRVCCGVTHPSADGMVCGPSLDTLIPTAIRRLNLPVDCAQITPPPNTPSGSMLVLGQGERGCFLEGVARLSGHRRLLAGAGLDINIATADDLTLLPGIGAVKAAAIVAHRVKHGPFRSLDDLVEVHGIGEKTVARIAPFTVCSGHPKAEVDR